MLRLQHFNNNFTINLKWSIIINGEKSNISGRSKFPPITRCLIEVFAKLL